MKAGNFARNAGIVITTSIATAAIASTQWDNFFKVTAVAITIILGAFLAAIAAGMENP